MAAIARIASAAETLRERARQNPLFAKLSAYCHRLVDFRHCARVLSSVLVE